MRSLVRLLADRLDEQDARRRRAAWGRAGWVVSWTPRDDGAWQARISCADWPRTIAARGRTRREAIRRAALSLQVLLRRLG